MAFSLQRILFVRTNLSEATTLLTKQAMAAFAQKNAVLTHYEATWYWLMLSHSTTSYKFWWMNVDFWRLRLVRNNV